MLAMQDALDEQKFQLFLTLIQKTADDATVQKKNDTGQNLMHILAINSSASAQQKAVILRIFNTLQSRGVDCLCADNLGNNALHYAVKCRADELVSLLLGNGIEINLVNNEGHSPLSLALKGANTPTLSNLPAQLMDPIWLKLLKHGANCNIIYPEDSHKDSIEGLKIPALLPDKKNKRVSAASDASKDAESVCNYRCSVLINYVQHDALTEEQMLATFRSLMQYGAKFDPVDSNGFTVLDHAIIKNNESLVQFILANPSGLQTDHRKPDGRTAVHLCVRPLVTGSFENVKILSHLKQSGYDLAALDNKNQTPLDFAMLMDSKVMAKALIQMMGAHADLSVRRRRNSLTPELEWPEFEYEFTEDAQTFLDEAEKKRALEVFEEKKELDYVPLDEEFAGQKQYKVYYDAEKKPWDVYMTKVDLKNGPYGDYVFYKMQMVFDQNRGLYIVLTRYGRIGERGMHQRSPFNDVEEAKTEFRTIFKQKSGNVFQSEDMTLQKKKYFPTQVNYSNVKHEDYLAPFDFENCANPSGLPKSVEDLVEEISNVSLYQRAIKLLGID